MQGQTMMTIRDVYDFNINDEFQYSTKNVPPNAIRIKVIGKHFSANNDTVFYVHYFNNYSSIVNYSTSPPHLDYTYSVGNDTVYYTNLDTLINSQYRSLPNDSCDSSKDTLYYSSLLCNVLLYAHSSCTSCCFEGQNHDETYGKGLGQTKYLYAYAAMNVLNQWDMYYYKKGAIVCGTPDSSTALSIIEKEKINENILLNPNPTSGVFNVQMSKYENAQIEVYNVMGECIYRHMGTSANLQIDLSAAKSGVYFLQLKTSEGTAVKKVVVNK